MKSKEIPMEKYIRKDDPKLDQSVDYINYLIDAYKQTDDMVYRDALLDSFDDYFKKYVNILHKGKGINVDNPDTKNFLRLFMKNEDRATHDRYLSRAGSYIHMIRRVLTGFSEEDLYHELIVAFLELVEKYSAVTYVRNKKKHRISFAHYCQVHIRYKMCKWIIDKSKDILTGKDCLEYKDELHSGALEYNDIEEDVGITLKDWVWGTTARVPFSGLTEMERYLLWLRYEGSPDGKKITTKNMALITGYHERSIIYKLNRIKEKLKDGEKV